MGRVVWNGWRVSCPFFFRPRQGAPRAFAIKVFFFVRAIMVAEITFEVMIGDPSSRLGNAGINIGMQGDAAVAFNRSAIGGFPVDGRRNGSYAGGAYFFDMAGGDRRVPMFRNVFVIYTDYDESSEMLLTETLITVPGITIRQRDPNSRISELYMRTADRVQIVCAREGSRQYTPETYSDLRSLQTSLVTPEERVRKILLTFSDFPMQPPQEIERLPGCNFSFNPEYSIYRWIQTASGRQYDLRQRLYEAARAITKCYFEVSDRPIPLGMLLLSGGNDFFSPGNYDSSTNMSSPWNLFFMCEDHASQTLRDEFAHQPIELRFDPQFLVDAYPLLKATVAILMYCRMSASDNVPFFPTPFNIYGLSKRFDEGMLIDMGNFYDEQVKEFRCNYYQNSFNSDNERGNNRRMFEREDYDFGPYQRMRNSGDFLANAVQYAESALSSLHQWGLGRSAHKVRTRLDELAPTWLQQCDMRPMELDLKVWWVSTFSYEERWKNLHMMVSPPGTPGYQQYLQLTGGGNGMGMYNGRSAEPFELDYQNSYFYQQQGRNINSAYRGPMTEISGRLMGDLGVKDFSVANEVAMRLCQEGCETWDDVLRLDEFVGSKNNFEDVKWFLREIGLPMVVASKLMMMMRNYRGGSGGGF